MYRTVEGLAGMVRLASVAMTNERSGIARRDELWSEMK
jgi:hypothetical protein